MARVASIGECMIELSQALAGCCRAAMAATP